MELPNESTDSKTLLRVALVESDPLRLVGFHALLEAEADLELISASLAEIATQAHVNVALIGDRPGQNLANTISNLKAIRPHMPIIVIGCSRDDETILNAIVSGARGYVFEGAPPSEFARAIRVVNQGSVWAPRRVISMFIELATNQQKRWMCGTNDVITEREKEILTLRKRFRSPIDQIGLVFTVMALVAALCSQATMAQVQSHADRKVVSKVAPFYPEVARRYRVKGVVKLEVVVRKNGSVESAKVLGGSPALIDAATDAVRKWKFEPAAEETTEAVRFVFEN